MELASIKELGEFLREARRSAGYSLRDVKNLAASLEQPAKISAPYLSQIEGGVRKNPPKPELLRVLAKIYKVSIRELLVRAGYQQPEPTEMSSDEEIERAFRFVLADNKFTFKTRLKGQELPSSAKRAIVEMYEKVSGCKLLSESSALKEK